jgi:hypothetical protein
MTEASGDEDPSITGPWEMLTRWLERNQRLLVPHIRQKVSNEGELVYERKPGCLLFAWYVWGIICSLGMFHGCASTWGHSGLMVLLFGGTGVGFLLAVLFGLFWTDQLSLNDHSRTYRRRRGVAVWIKTTAGSFDELSHLELREREDSEGGLFYEVLVVWKSRGEKPFSLLQTAGEPDAGREARELHEQLVTKLQLPGEVKAPD